MLPYIKLLFSSRQYYRIIECIYGCFKEDLLFPIIKENTEVLLKCIACKEGYFMIKALVSSVKSEINQMLIVNTILAHLHSYLTFNNGILIVKLIIKQFLESSYTYTKNASKHLTENSVNLVINHVFDQQKITSKALEFLIRGLSFNVSCWDTKSWRSIIIYGLKTLPIISTMICAIMKSNIGFFIKFLSLRMSDKCLNLMINNLSDSDIFNLSNSIQAVFTKVINPSHELCKTIISIYQLAVTISKKQLQPKMNSSYPNNEFKFVNNCHQFNLKALAQPNNHSYMPHNIVLSQPVQFRNSLPLMNNHNQGSSLSRNFLNYTVKK